MGAAGLSSVLFGSEVLAVLNGVIISCWGGGISLSGTRKDWISCSEVGYQLFKMSVSAVHGKDKKRLCHVPNPTLMFQL